MKSLHLISPAKLNLFLHVTGRRADGYHELQTLFHLLDVGDHIIIGSVSGGDIELNCPAVKLPPEENLAWRAARLLQEHTGSKRGAVINIEKRVPPGGGLGGGSSNAATVLLALNRLWRLKLPQAQLAELGLRLGADVPVFVGGRTAWAEGIGERLEPLKLPRRHYLVLVPNCQVSTAEIFSHYSQRELTRGNSAFTITTFLREGGRNDCESIVRQLHPEVDRAMKWLGSFGQARLTGTGACVFAEFATNAMAEAALRQLPMGWRGFAATGVNRSSVHRALELE